MLVEVLDDELTLIGDCIDQQCGTADTFSLNDDQDPAAWVGSGTVCAKCRAQRNNRDEAPSCIQHLTADSQAFDVRRHRAKALHDMRQRHDQGLLTHLHNHSVGYGQSQWHSKNECRPKPRPRLDGDPTAQFLHVLAHNIHANTAPGNA